MDLESLSRRSLLRLAAGWYVASLTGCAAMPRRGRAPEESSDAIAEWLQRHSPVDRTAPGTDRFAADDVARAHAFLWNRSEPDFDAAPLESAGVVVLGGGMSGLLSAYLLRDLSPVVLEQSDRFGGHSRSEAWESVEYPLGAAYLCEPAPESDAAAVLRELAVETFSRRREGHFPVLVGGKLRTGWWRGETAPEAASQFVRFKRYLDDVCNERRGLRYPNLPTRSRRDEAVVGTLDTVSLDTHLRKVLLPKGGTLHPEIVTFLDRYCFSTFAAAASEVSAAAGLNFLAAEAGPVLVPSGGNGRIAEALLEKLAFALPNGHLRPRSMALRVRSREGKSVVDYLDADGRPRRVQARQVVVAVPKYVALRLFDDLPADRQAAFRAVEYRAYVVANVRLSRRPEGDEYDVFSLDGSAGGVPPALEASVTSDVTRARFASLDRSGRQPRTDAEVLTFFRALPFTGARPGLLAPDAFERLRACFERELDGFLPALGVRPDAVRGIRLVRWGHAMPVPKVGIYRQRLPERLSASLGGTVHFAHQDNWCLPAFETAMDAALAVSSTVREALLKG